MIWDVPIGRDRRYLGESNALVDAIVGGWQRFTMPWPQGTLEFRAEFFNLLNRTNFRAPNGNRSAAGFGTITSTYDPRQIQLGVKVNF